jgi:predicted NUDIX family NTP pyrophosphohydrolase
MVAHLGGPYFAKRDDGWWSIVKGIVEQGETDLEAAGREFREETGWEPPDRPWVELGESTLRSKKVVVAYAAHADFDPATLVSEHFFIGPRSYPEVDRVEWMSPDRARIKLNPALAVFVDRLVAHLEARGNILR